MKDILKNTTIKSKLNRILLFLVLIIFLSSGYALIKATKTKHELTYIIDTDFSMMSIITKIANHQLEQIRYLEQALRLASLSQQQNIPETISNSIAHFNYHDAQISANLMTATRLSQRWGVNAPTDNERIAFNNFEKALINYKQIHLDFKQHTLPLFTLLTQGDFQKATQITDEMKKDEDTLKSQKALLLNKLEAIKKDAVDRAAAHKHIALTFLKILVIISLITAIIVILNLSNNIETRMHASSKDIESDTSNYPINRVEACSTDEMGKLQQSITNMQLQLNDMITHINNTTYHLSTAADKLSSINIHATNDITKYQTKRQDGFS